MECCSSGSSRVEKMLQTIELSIAGTGRLSTGESFGFKKRNKEEAFQSIVLRIRPRSRIPTKHSQPESIVGNDKHSCCELCHLSSQYRSSLQTKYGHVWARRVSILNVIDSAINFLSDEKLCLVI